MNLEQETEEFTHGGASVGDRSREADGSTGPPRRARAPYYALNRSPEPNLLSDLLLAGLVRVAGCAAGEKILLSLLLILLILALLAAEPRQAATVWRLVVGSLALLALVRRVRRREAGGDGLLLVAAAGTAVSLALLALHFAAYLRLSGPLEEYASVQARLPRGAAVLPVSFLDDPDLALDPSLVSYKIRPYEHAVGYLACERPLVDLANYQADQGYFAIVYREPRNPYSHFYREGQGRWCRGGIDLAGYERRGGAVDAVLLWGRRYSERGDEAEALLAGLGGDYTLAFTSRPRGLAELYVRRPVTVAARP